MKSRYLSNSEIRQMAHAALSNYEFSCEWRKAFAAADEYARDELLVSPTRAQSATATNMAKVMWESMVIDVQGRIQ